MLAIPHNGNLSNGLLFNGIRLSLLKDQITAAKGFGVPLTLLQNLENLRLMMAAFRNVRFNR